MRITGYDRLGPKERLFFAAALSFLFASAYIHFISANASDKNWLLVAAGEWLSGKRLYTDIFEVNPPLIVWLYAIPVWFSRHITFLSDSNFLALMGLVAVALVVMLCNRMLAVHSAFAGHDRRRLAFALLLAYVFVFFTAPMYFFDREHILLVLTFPYVLRFSPDLARRRFSSKLRIAIGLAAAIGFCIKPHAAAVFILLQLFYIVRERSASILVSMENGIIYSFGALYLASLPLLMPEYFHTVIPMAMTTYSAYSRKANGAYSIIICVVMLGMIFADFRPRHASPYRGGVYYFLGVCLAYLLYGLINNGWSYTYNPLMSVVRILAGWVLLEFVWLRRKAGEEGRPEKPFIFGARSCAITLLLNLLFFMVCLVAYLLPFNCSQSASCLSTSRFFTAAKAYPAHSFGAMSLEFYKWSELTRETGERWDTRFNHLWMLPKFLMSGPDFTREHQNIINYVGNAYADDLNHWKPDLFYIDSSPEFFRGHPHFDLAGYFSVVPAFSKALEHYRRIDTLDACQPALPGEGPSKAVKSDCRFDVYRRKPGS